MQILDEYKLPEEQSKQVTGGIIGEDSGPMGGEGCNGCDTEVIEQCTYSAEYQSC